MARRRWLDSDEQRVWRAYLLTTQLVDEALDRQLQRDAQMPHAYYGILVGLNDAADRPGQGAIRMTDLARRLRYSQSRLTHAITSMERSGWVERRDCPTDRRSQLVAITARGTEALRDAAPGHVAAVRSAVFDQLTEEQVTQLGEICAAIVGGFDRAVTPVTPSAPQPSATSSATPSARQLPDAEPTGGSAARPTRRARR